jgi:hypothetical protein
MGQNREHRATRRALETPDGDPTQADTDVMGVACQTPISATGGLVLELKAKGHDEGDDTFEERLPIAKQLEVGRFAPEIDSDGAVFAGLASGASHGSPSGQMVVATDDPGWG